MNFILKTILGDRLTITEEEHKAFIAAQPEQTLFLKNSGIMVKKSMVAIIYPENRDDIEKKKNQVVGRLHDGGRVKKHFGQWVLDTGQTPDDKGNYAHVTLDPAYYPEVALDCVATEEEFTKLNGQDYYEFLGIKERDKRLDSGFKQIMECPKNS